MKARAAGMLEISSYLDGLSLGRPLALGSHFASREFFEGGDEGAARAQKLDKEKISSNVKFVPDKSLKKLKTAKPCQAKNLTKQAKNFTKA
jgi:hypothetical protein